MNDKTADVEKLRGVLAAATPGVWRWSENGNIVTDVALPGDDPEIAAVYSEHEDHAEPANSALIVAMHESLPALLDELTEMRAEKEAAKKIAPTFGLDWKFRGYELAQEKSPVEISSEPPKCVKFKKRYQWEVAIKVITDGEEPDNTALLAAIAGAQKVGA